MSNLIQLEHLQEVYQDISQLVGYENMLILFDYYKGQQVNFPVRLQNRNYLLSKLLLEHDGSNIRQLARETGYSERWVRRLIKQYGGKAMSEDAIYKVRCSYTQSGQFTEGQQYPVYFTPSGDYVLDDRRKRIYVEDLDDYGNFDRM